VKRWIKDRVEGRIGATAHDLVRLLKVLPSDGFGDGKRAAENIVDLAKELIDGHYIDLGKAVLEEVVKTALRPAISELFEDSDQFDKLAKMLHGVNEMKQAVGAADTDRP
jgi:hypothetical protein